MFSHVVFCGGRVEPNTVSKYENIWSLCLKNNVLKFWTLLYHFNYILDLTINFCAKFSKVFFLGGGWAKYCYKYWLLVQWTIMRKEEIAQYQK